MWLGDIVYHSNSSFNQQVFKKLLLFVQHCAKYDVEKATWHKICLDRVHPEWLGTQEGHPDSSQKGGDILVES